jgi:PAS domain S-box-containing protein
MKDENAIMHIFHPRKKMPYRVIFQVLVIMVLGAIYIRYTWMRIENKQTENVLQVARNIETFLPKDGVKEYKEKLDEVDFAKYQIIKRALEEIVRVNPKARFAYIYTERNGKVYFVADSEPEDSKDYSPPGQEYTEIQSENKLPFVDGKERITSSLSDRWGTWRSALIPIKDKITGRTYAILGLDYDARSWTSFVLIDVIESSVLSALLLFVMLLFIIIKTKNKSLIKEGTERRKVEKENLLLAYAVRSISDCVSITDMSDRLLFVNKTLLETYQYEEHELVGKSVDFFRSQNNPHDIEKEILPATLAGGWHGELLNRKKDGTDFPIFLSTSVIHDESGEPVALIGVARDITKQKELEAVLLTATQDAEMANKAKSIFLANMSHEIRTPLNAIIGFSQLMNRESLLTDSQKEYNISIIRAGEHLLSLINDILELSKMEAGRLELNPVSVDLQSLFVDMQMIFKEPAKTKHLQFIFETDPDVPQYVIVDDNKLRRIFINLIGNAIKFTSEGGIAVRVRVDKIDEVKSNLIAEIQDSGTGIPENELGKLFKHFVQTSAGISKSSGSGLGLALSRELAVLMGGDITLSSEVGKGSVFTFHVEIKKGMAGAHENIIRKRVAGIEKVQENYRILVVDDKVENLQVVVNLLKMVGFETMEAVNGEEAITKFEAWNPHLILMDMRMPVMDGYEATRRIKLTEKGKLTPIVALTASSFENERRKTIALGMQGHIRKPFRESELFGTIGNILGINYIYEEEASVTYEKYYASNETIAEDISKLPYKLVSQMKDAVAVADLDLLIHLIHTIESDNPDLANHLIDLANNYDYDYLKQILNKTEANL